MRLVVADGVAPAAGAAASAGLLARAEVARATAAGLCTTSVRAARHHVSLSVAATPSTPAHARRLFAELAEGSGATADGVDGVKTVVSELVSNVVQHAYVEMGGAVYLDAAVVGQTMTIIIADDGRGPRVPSPRPGLGHGWKVIAGLADQFTILQRGTGGTEVHVRLPVAPDPTRDAPRDGVDGQLGARRPNRRFSTTA